jgi:hypothetical protein
MAGGNTHMMPHIQMVPHYGPPMGGYGGQGGVSSTRICWLLSLWLLEFFVTYQVAAEALRLIVSIP